MTETIAPLGRRYELTALDLMLLWDALESHRQRLDTPEVFYEREVEATVALQQKIDRYLWAATTQLAPGGEIPNPDQIRATANRLLSFADAREAADRPEDVPYRRTLWGPNAPQRPGN